MTDDDARVDPALGRYLPHDSWTERLIVTALCSGLLLLPVARSSMMGGRVDFHWLAAPTVWPLALIALVLLASLPFLFLLTRRAAIAPLRHQLATATRLLCQATPDEVQVTTWTYEVERVWETTRTRYLQWHGAAAGSYRVLLGTPVLPATATPATRYADPKIAENLQALRLEDGTVVLCAGRTVQQEWQEEAAALPPASRRLSTGLRLHLITQCGTAGVLATVGALFLLFSVHLGINAVIAVDDVAAGLFFAAGVGLLLGAVHELRKGWRRMQLLAEGRLGWARVVMEDAEGAARRRVRLAVIDDSGETETVELVTNTRHRWPTYAAVPVLRHAQGATAVYPLEAYVGPRGYARVQGDILVSATAAHAMTAINLVTLALLTAAVLYLR